MDIAKLRFLIVMYLILMNFHNSYSRFSSTVHYIRGTQNGDGFAWPKKLNVNLYVL